MAVKTTLKIQFDSEEAARQFGYWLCESGEQQYWDWMSYRESDEDDTSEPITAIAFHYFPPWEGADVEFLEDWTIRTELGRLDR